MEIDEDGIVKIMMKFCAKFNIIVVVVYIIWN